MVSNLATSVGIETGFNSNFFAISVVFASIIMFDAQSVRRAVSEQAKILNFLIEEIFINHKISKNRLSELLGHTPIQVFAGAGVGILTALILKKLFF